MQHSPLLDRKLDNNLSVLQRLTTDKNAPVLDLACGGGRNGLYLIKNDIPVTFADVNGAALEQIKLIVNRASAEQQTLAQYWQVDFEQVGAIPLPEHAFAGVMVFRYLHRPLFEQLKNAIKPGGIIIYETFTEQQAQFGRPKNPDFLLKSAELLELFVGWEILHSFEGVVSVSEHSNTVQAIAQIVAVKPN